MRAVFICGAIAAHLFCAGFVSLVLADKPELAVFNPFRPWLAIFIACVGIIVHQLLKAAEEDAKYKNPVYLSDEEHEIIYALRKDMKK